MGFLADHVLSVVFVKIVNPYNVQPSCVNEATLKNRGHLTEYRVPLNCSLRGESNVFS